MKEKLNRYFPYVKAGFDRFLSSLYLSESDDYFHWIPVAELDDLDDEGQIQIPRRCATSYFGNTIYEKVQAIVRKKVSSNGQEKVYFFYVPAWLKVLSQKKVHYSFLLVHEWLWEVTDSAEKNRELNYFLHSEEIDKMSHIQVKREIERILK